MSTLRRFLNETLPSRHSPVSLNAEEARHCLLVLRLEEQSLVEVLDGRGTACLAKIEIKNSKKQEVLLHFDSEVPENELKKRKFLIPVCLEVSILKPDAFEWVIEKAAELGIESLQPVITRHMVIAIDKKGVEHFQSRWQKIADQALKQCGRLNRMTVEFPKKMTELPFAPETARLWCDEKFEASTASFQSALANTHSSSLRVLIGPEGGFSEEEKSLLKKNSDSTTAVHLGPLILRAETAALFSASLLQAHFDSRVKIDK